MNYFIVLSLDVGRDLGFGILNLIYLAWGTSLLDSQLKTTSTNVTRQMDIVPQNQSDQLDSLLAYPYCSCQEDGRL
jgi:hypothetical protein